MKIQLKHLAIAGMSASVGFLGSMVTANALAGERGVDLLAGHSHRLYYLSDTVSAIACAAIGVALSSLVHVRCQRPLHTAMQPSSSSSSASQGQTPNLIGRHLGGISQEPLLGQGVVILNQNSRLGN